MDRLSGSRDTSGVPVGGSGDEAADRGVGMVLQHMDFDSDDVPEYLAPELAPRLALL